MKKKKQRVQNSALILLKRKGMVFNAFKSGIFSMPLKKKIEIESDNLFPPECYGRPSRLSETLSERLTQGRGIKILPPK